LFADIGENRDRLDPQIPGLTRDRLCLLLIGARVDHDIRPFAGQPQHSRTADIATRSGDQCDLPFELAHAPITPTIFAADSASRLRLCTTTFQSRALTVTLEVNGVPRLGPGPAQCSKIRLLRGTARASARLASRAVNAIEFRIALAPLFG